jgi:hypothetical protein
VKCDISTTEIIRNVILIFYSRGRLNSFMLLTYVEDCKVKIKLIGNSSASFNAKERI